MKKHREFYVMLCQNIKDELKRKKMVYRQAAPLIGMSMGLFCNKISGHGFFNTWEICKIAKVLNIPVIDLMEGLEV